MKVETIDRLIMEDMKRDGKSMEEILKCIPKKRRKEFKRNVLPKIGWYEKLKKALT